MKTAALYIRVSTDDQTEYSPDAQKRALMEYARRNDIMVESSNIFVDEGKSGRNADKRPEFMRMIASAKTKPRPFDLILVHKFDRFARSREDSIVYKSLLRKECGIQVVSITEQIEDDKFSVILEAMLEAMAEYYSLNLADEVKKGMTEKALRGEVQTKASYGYRMKNKALEVVPEEAEVVRRMYQSVIDGKTCFGIAQLLNDAGIRNKNGNRWENRTVRYVIANPLYKGYVRWNPTGKKDLRQFRFQNENFIVSQGTHEPIVSEEIWEQANAMIEKKFTPNRKPADMYKNWMSGIMICDTCGGKLASGGSKAGFQCMNYAKGKCHVSHYISSAKAEQLTLEALSEMSFTGDFTFSQAKSDDKNQELINLSARLEKAVKMENRAKEAYLGGIDTLEEYKKNKASIQKEINAINEAIEKAKAPSEAGDKKEMLERIENVCQLLQSENVDKLAKNSALRSIVDKIIYNKKEGTFDVFLIYR